MKILAFILSLCATQAQADERLNAFVSANLLAIFYHELGHALIDTMDLPIFGQEEDAADVLSILLIDELFEEDDTVSVAYDAALGFWAEAEQSDEIAFWDTHGPDLQRFYNTVCLFYGANPEERADVADDLGLPADRIDTCEEEYELAIDSWGGVLDELVGQSKDTGINFEADASADESDWTALVQSVIAQEVVALNQDFAVPVPISVRVASCDEANAFYDPETKMITICTEFAAYLAEIAPEL